MTTTVWIYWTDSNTWCPRLTAAKIFFVDCGPDERFAVIVGLREDGVDGGLKINEARKAARLRRRLDSLAAYS